MTHTSCFNDVKELRFFFIMYRELEIAFELAAECCAMNFFSTMNLRNYIQDLRKNVLHHVEPATLLNTDILIYVSFFYQNK